MNAAPTGNSPSYLGQYITRLQRALNSTSSSVATSIQSTFTPISLVEAPSSTTLHTTLRWIIYILIVAFVILLILAVIHFTVKPIFGVPGNSALITVSAGDWAKDWNNASAQYSDVPAVKTLPKTNYTFVFDMRVRTPTPTIDTGNRFVVLYKTTAGQAGQTETSTGSSTGGSGTQTVQCSTTSSTTGTAAAGSSSTLTTNVQPITSFSFLNTNTVPHNGDPSLILLYDSLSNTLEARLVTRTTTGDLMFATVAGDIVPATPYRVGIIVSDSILEMYINGQLASSLPYTGRTPAGSDTDTVYSTPAKYNSNIEVRNLFTLARVANSGEIANLGGAAL